MSASAFELYNKAKEYIGDGTIDLDTDVFYVVLCKSGSNASDLTLTAWGSLTNVLSTKNGWLTSGESLTGVTWTTGASAKQIRFDATDWVTTASGGSLDKIQFAVIMASGNQLLCKSKLSTSGIDITDTNTLTIQFSASGIFTLA